MFVRQRGSRIRSATGIEPENYGNSLTEPLNGTSQRETLLTLSAALETSTATRDPLLLISNGIVQLYKGVLGRGPRRARTSYAGPDSLVVVLQHTLTTAELTLAALGELRRLHETRHVVEAALEPRARAIVEQVLGRRTLAFVCGLDPGHDVAVMFFTLAPRTQELDGEPAGGA